MDIQLLLYVYKMEEKKIYKKELSRENRHTRHENSVI